jgi:dienelactone hydrolase
MKHLLSALIICTLSLTIGSTFVLAQNPQPTPDKRDKMEMDNTMMAMSDHHDEMRLHMRMTSMRALRQGDRQRANEIVETSRRVLEKYKDYKAALADGFQIFMPNVPLPMYHFTNYRYALEAESRFNPEHPTSLLYEKQGDSYKVIGAMYTASAQRSENELDRVIPLSIAQWHEHVNFCFPPGDRRAEMLMPGSRFGMLGSISTKADCDRAGGTFLPRLFGWMVHVYPFEQTADKIWSVEKQMHNAMNTPPVSTPRGSEGVGAAKTPAAGANSTVKQSVVTFMSDDKEITSELFAPTKPGRYPAVVLLYGSGGMAVGGPMFQSTAESLAKQGYVVYLPHYFEKTGTQFATPEEDRKYFADWMKTIANAIEYAAKQPNVDPKRIGLIGYSLGAYLSLSVATVDSRVKAVVEYFGGLPPFFVNQLKTMPPTLILHGEADPLVSVKEAYALERLLKSKSLPYEIKIYPQQGHGFSGTAVTDSMQRTLAFFDRNLKK